MIRPALITLGLFILVGVVLALTGIGRPAKPIYYLAIGDSLAAGTTTRDGRPYRNSSGFTQPVLEEMRKYHPDVKLKKIACPGSTIEALVSRPSCNNPATTMLEEARQFIQAHPGQVALVTITIGGNNFLGCANAQSFQPECIKAGSEQLATWIPVIMTKLQEVGNPHDGRVIVTNLYPAFSAYYIAGQRGRDIAQQTNPIVNKNTKRFSALVEKSGGEIADVYSAFGGGQEDQLAELKPQGRVPLPTARVCMWTLACSVSFDPHPNSQGYRVIAQTILNQMRSHCPAGLRHPEVSCLKSVALSSRENG